MLIVLHGIYRISQSPICSENAVASAELQMFLFPSQTRHSAASQRSHSRLDGGHGGTTWVRPGCTLGRTANFHVQQGIGIIYKCGDQDTCRSFCGYPCVSTATATFSDECSTEVKTSGETMAGRGPSLLAKQFPNTQPNCPNCSKIGSRRQRTSAGTRFMVISGMWKKIISRPVRLRNCSGQPVAVRAPVRKA